MFSIRDILTLVTLGTLFHGALELKSYLEVNFVENDTPIKAQVNKALNGQLDFKKSEK
ncbi:MAG: hypothetical protein KC478_06715 [Bacteriovoracaceae bacterium]|nr:hypothetical protein [Bacteriovoracaceae bacterium]